MRQAAVETLRYSIGLLLLGGLAQLISIRTSLPDVPAILNGVGVLWSEGSLSPNIQVSTARWLIGWTLGAVVGVTAGLLTGRVQIARP